MSAIGCSTRPIRLMFGSPPRPTMFCSLGSFFAIGAGIIDGLPGFRSSIQNRPNKGQEGLCQLTWAVSALPIECALLYAPGSRRLRPDAEGRVRRDRPG